MPFALISISPLPTLLSILSGFGLVTYMEVCHSCKHFCHLTQALSQKSVGVVLYGSICVATAQARSMQLKQYPIRSEFAAMPAVPLPANSHIVHLMERNANIGRRFKNCL